MLVVGCWLLVFLTPMTLPTPLLAVVFKRIKILLPPTPYFQIRLHELLSHHERMKSFFPYSLLPTPHSLFSD
ncbi:MAG TPA: hypothetical protein DCP31_07475 [Cyanobacteria bacterium UBA8543]|nr:hypothetical protein [Cyanobacteria bacterium UBA8543]